MDPRLAATAAEHTDAPSHAEAHGADPVPHGVPLGVGVTVQLAVPLHERVAQVSDAQVMRAPPQTPVPEHWSLNVHGFPSSQGAPVFTVTVQDDDPLHVRDQHGSETHEIGVPLQTLPPRHWSA